MHPKAEAWNKTKYPHLDGKTPHHLIPFNRPCDWCGEIVDIGWIHKPVCLDKERTFWLDLLY